jgi:hypothetical protein
MLNGLRAALVPVGTAEDLVVERIAFCYWKLRRNELARVAGIVKRTTRTLQKTQSLGLEKLMSNGFEDLSDKEQELHGLMNSKPIRDLPQAEKERVFANLQRALLGAVYLPDDREFEKIEVGAASIRRELNAAYKQLAWLQSRRRPEQNTEIPQQLEIRERSQQTAADQQVDTLALLGDAGSRSETAVGIGNNE